MSPSAPGPDGDAGAGATEARWAAVRARVDAAAVRAGRDPAAVRIVAATKTVPADRLAALVRAGCRDLGENRAQELLTKASGLTGVTWHFIGHLQRNKVRALAPLVAWWHTLDRPALVPVLAEHAPGATVLVEVNLAREPQKSGCAPEAVPALVGEARAAGLEVVGLMAVPPRDADPRPWFRTLARAAAAEGLPELSMGMSEDFEVAVEEGATVVRLGRVLLGDRPSG